MKTFFMCVGIVTCVLWVIFVTVGLCGLGIVHRDVKAGHEAEMREESRRLSGTYDELGRLKLKYERLEEKVRTMELDAEKQKAAHK